MENYPDELLNELGDSREERALHHLEGPNIDRELSGRKPRRRGANKKHKLKWMKRPMAIPGVILELYDEELREGGLRALSAFLVEKGKEDPENYHRIAFFAFYSSSTICILLQEVLQFYIIMDHGVMNRRSLKRLANVLILFQSIAANSETRQKFVLYRVPDYLIPIITFQSKEELFDNIRADALSVIGILCQARDTKIMAWALNNSIIEVCCTVISIGNELSKVIALHIIESIIHSQMGISFLCNPLNEETLNGLINTWNQLVAIMSDDEYFSPRLLFHIIRCYFLLCTHPRGLVFTTNNLPKDLTKSSFLEVAEEFPVIKNLLHQLLLFTGKFEAYLMVQENSSSRLYSHEKYNDSSWLLTLKAHEQNIQTCLPA